MVTDKKSLSTVKDFAAGLQSSATGKDEDAQESRKTKCVHCPLLRFEPEHSQVQYAKQPSMERPNHRYWPDCVGVIKSRRAMTMTMAA